MRCAVALVFVALLAGCGGTSGSSLEDAADATAAETSRFEMSYRFGEEGKQGGELKAVGLIDYPNKRGVMMISGSGAEGIPHEFRLIGDVGYVKSVIKGKAYWVKEVEQDEPSGDPFELLVPAPGSPVKPTDVLTRVLLASDENEEVGKELVRDTQTTHYRARVDLEKLVKQLSAADRPDGDAEELSGIRFIPVELWIDDKSRLRRIVIKEPKREAQGVPSMTTTVDLFDYGLDVDVEPPPDDELISQEEFDKLTEVEADEQGCEAARENLPKKEADRMCLEMKETG